MSNKLDFSRELIGRRALVTGGTKGIGAAIAQRLLDAGAKVVVTARSRGEALPAGAAFVAGDVASAAGVKAIAAGALDALGGLDILVNNAGGANGFPQGTASIPDEEWQAAFALNLFAASEADARSRFRESAHLDHPRRGCLTKRPRSSGSRRILLRQLMRRRC